MTDLASYIEKLKRCQEEIDKWTDYKARIVSYSGSVVLTWRTKNQEVVPDSNFRAEMEQAAVDLCNRKIKEATERAERLLPKKPEDAKVEVVPDIGEKVSKSKATAEAAAAAVEAAQLAASIETALALPTNPITQPTVVDTQGLPGA